MKNTSNGFDSQLDIIGINPFVFIPDDILESLFLQANRRKSPIPVKGTVNGVDYQQTLVKYKGYWRLYINTSMLKDSPKRIGEILTISINFDPEDRTLQPHPK